MAPNEQYINEKEAARRRVEEIEGILSNLGLVIDLSGLMNDMKDDPWSSRAVSVAEDLQKLLDITLSEKSLAGSEDPKKEAHGEKVFDYVIASKGGISREVFNRIIEKFSEYLKEKNEHLDALAEKVDSLLKGDSE